MKKFFFVGFYLPQFFILFTRRQKVPGNKYYAFLFAALLSSVIFALCHLQGSMDALLFLTFGGLVGSTIYYLTNNIFYGMILHGYFNAPLPLIECDEMTAKLVVVSLVLGIVIMTSFRKLRNMKKILLNK